MEAPWSVPREEWEEFNRVLGYAPHGTGDPCSSGLQKGLQGSNWTFSSMVDAGLDRGVHACMVLCLVHQTLPSAVPTEAVGVATLSWTEMSVPQKWNRDAPARDPVTERKNKTKQKPLTYCSQFSLY